MSARAGAVPQIASDAFRRVLGHLPTGVTVVTAYGSEQPAGMAANSVTSLSLEPPLILLCPAKSSTTWPAIRAAGRFCVNILAGHHEAICRRFAAKGGDRFAGVAWHDRPGGPALDDAAAWIECAIRDEHDAGDHTIVVADVLAIEAAEERVPLVFFRGRYGTFAAPTADASRREAAAGPRVLPVREPDEEQRALLARTPTGRDGRPLNVFATLARSPHLLRAISALGGVLTSRGRLAPRARELVILRTAARTQCAYEVLHHRVIAREVGLSGDDVAAALDPTAVSAWPDADAALLAFADELLDRDTVSDGTWDRLSSWFDDGQRMELLALVGFYRLLAGVLNGLRVELDASPAALRTGLSGSPIHDN